ALTEVPVAIRVVRQVRGAAGPEAPRARGRIPSQRVDRGLAAGIAEVDGTVVIDELVLLQISTPARLDRGVRTEHRHEYLVVVLRAVGGVDRQARRGEGGVHCLN